MPVSGVLNSWLTTETKSLFARFKASSSVTTRRCCANASADAMATRSSCATASMRLMSSALHSRGWPIWANESAPASLPPTRIGVAATAIASRWVEPAAKA